MSTRITIIRYYCKQTDASDPSLHYCIATDYGAKWCPKCRIHVAKAANLDLSDPFPFLKVRFFPFREVKRTWLTPT